MRKLKLLLVAALAVVAFASAVPKTSAESSSCQLCALYNDCFDCCRCAGGLVPFCASHCP
jgi:hypothetical protein